MKTRSLVLALVAVSLFAGAALAATAVTAPTIGATVTTGGTGNTALVGSTAPGYTAGSSIVDSFHNLSVNGPGNIKSDTVANGGTTEVCVFCHTPHNATRARLLWNKVDWASYPNQVADFGDNGDATTNMGTNWNSVTLQPDSLRCLSCHDGSTSVGQVAYAYTQKNGAAINYQIPLTGSDQTGGKINNSAYLVGAFLNGAGNRDMSKNHPVSIPYGASGNTYNGIASQAVQPGDNNFVAATNAATNPLLKGSTGAYGVECTSCHDVHGQGDPTVSATLPNHLGQMMNVGMDGSNLCLTCHVR